MDQNRSLTPDEAAAILKITKHTVYEMIKRGDLPAYRIGRKLRIDPRDIDIYRQQGKKSEFSSAARRFQEVGKIAAGLSRERKGNDTGSDTVVICGQDILLDILSRHLEQHLKPMRALRYQAGSFDGLTALYHGQADMAGIHLWDGKSRNYNTTYVRYLLPGIPTIMIHLAQRMQGFYVQQGNVKEIKDWTDLQRPDIIMINREKGCGTRVLLDEKLREFEIDSRSIQGYKREEYSHLGVASTVARGEADVGLGIEKAYLQVRGLDFIPLQKERYDLVMTEDKLNQSQREMVLEIVRSSGFISELQGLGDYDLSETGKIVTES